MARSWNGQHAQAWSEAGRIAKQAQISEREADVIRQIVMGGSALVTCGAGLDVQHLLCGFDSCYLTIRHLPQDTKCPEIEELFTQQGINSSLFYVVNRRQADDEVEAKVLMDAEVGQAVAAGLNGISFKGSVLDITLNEGWAPNKMGSIPERATRVLTIVWRLPSSTMIVEYGSAIVASNAVDMLNNTIFGGRRIRAELNRIHGARNFDRLSTSVKISGLPVNATENEVQNHSGAPIIRVIRPLSTFDNKDVERDLRRHLRHLELVEPFEAFEAAPPDPENGEVRVRFRTWDDAKKVHDLLKGSSLKAGYPTFHVRLPKSMRYVITIPLAQYRAQKGRWDSMTERNDEKAAFVKIVDNGRDRASIRVVGDDKKAVGQLKVRVENLIAGEVLDGKLWHRTFMSIPGRLLLNNIGSRTGAYLRGDWKTKTLRLYADGDVKQTVIGHLENEIKGLESSEWPVRVPHRAVRFFMRTGLPRLKEELGEDAVTFELVPTPWLFVRGGEEARLLVDRLIQEFRTGIGSEAERGEGDPCPICFDEVSGPVPLSCGHFYCTACFRLFLESAVERKAFPLVCTGDEDRCRAPIPIPIIRRFLLQQQFDQLVEAAVTTYIEKHPNKFKYCTTADCTQVYRCERGSTRTLACPSCFVTICTGCHKEAHEGMTCGERENMGNSGDQELNEEWAEAAGVKHCPSCQVWIQKSEGCNHMACQCGAHICWLCLVSFPDADGIYAHLRAVHGGIYDDHILQEQAARIQDDFEFAQRLQRELEEEHA